MERRGWPWKKKITEKIASAALEFKQSNEQLDSRIDLKDQHDGMTPLQQAEAKLKILTEQLASKNEVVLQHAKVAEEAVSGWEKAESEAASMRQQLDAETQKRLATEDWVSHLDGALKECTRQLRHVQEQQEQKNHETVVKKMREWEAVRKEMEAKMTMMENKLLEAEAEKVAMGRSLQERAKAIKEAKEGRSRAEEEVKLLQVRSEVAEKEQTKWKYELHVLSKELEIRNEELEYNKKVSEVANKKHLENVKKVAKLETECQRLRLLVRKKLPGPAAVAQMRMEVEALGMVPSVPIERQRWIPPSHRSQTNAWKPDRGGTPWMMGGDADGEQLLAMADENKILKEALRKSNSELQAARLLCAGTASKLSSVDEQWENASTVSSYLLPRSKRSAIDGFMGSTLVGSSQEPSVASVSEHGPQEDESNCAESWATGLISELAQFSKKEKVSSVSDTMVDLSSCDLMDDFAEMEKLASMPPDSHTINGLAATASQEHSGVIEDQIDSHADLPALNDKMQSISRLCDDLQRKLSGAEEELNTIRFQKLAAKAALLSTEKHLVTILQQAGDATSLSDVLDEVRAALNEERGLENRNTLDPTASLARSCLEMESAEVRDTRVWSPSGLSSCQSEESISKQDIPLVTIKVNSVAPELATAMNKVVCLVEALSQVNYDVRNADVDNIGDSSDSRGHADVLKQWRSSEFDSCVQSLVTLCNGVLHGKVDIIDFLAEMASALDWLVNHIFSLPNKLLETYVIGRRHVWDKGLINPNDSQTIDTVMELSTSVCKSYGITAEALPIAAGESTRNSEQESLSISLNMHMKKIHSLVEQLSQLKSEKDEADDKLKLLIDELTALKSKFEELTLNASELQSSLTSALERQGSLMTDVADLVSLKSLLESQLLAAKDDVRKLEERVLSLEVQLQDETQCRKDIEAMYQDLLDRQSGSTRERKQADDKPNIPEVSEDELAVKIRKEQEIAAAAEKLAECQQTILALGKQLKDLGVSNEGDGTPAFKLLSYRSPVTEHRSHSLSDQLPSESGNNGSLYVRGMESPSTSPIRFRPPIGEEESSLDHARLHTYTLHGSQRGHNDGRHWGASYGGHTDGRHAGASHSPLLSPDTSRGSGIVSPIFHEASTRHVGASHSPLLSPDTSRGSGIVSPIFHEASSRHATSSSLKDLALTSPARSPARFFSLKGRAWVPKPDQSSSEKHAMGFSRFFSRNKMSQ